MITFSTRCGCHTCATRGRPYSCVSALSNAEEVAARGLWSKIWGCSVREGDKILIASSIYIARIDCETKLLALPSTINLYGQVRKMLRDYIEGCSVILQGPGHAAPAAIKRLAARMRQADCPIMPLGPIPTDLAIGQDHVSAASLSSPLLAGRALNQSTRRSRVGSIS